MLVKYFFLSQKTLKCNIGCDVKYEISHNLFIPKYLILKTYKSWNIMIFSLVNLIYVIVTFKIIIVGFSKFLWKQLNLPILKYVNFTKISTND